MQYLFIALLALPSFVFAQDINDATMTTPTCETYIEWTGKNIDEVDLTILGERAHRVLKPSSMATMDYSPDRLNINITEDGVVLSQDCG